MSFLNIPTLIPDYEPSTRTEIIHLALARAAWGSLAMAIKNDHISKDDLIVFLDRFNEKVISLTKRRTPNYVTFEQAFRLVLTDDDRLVSKGLQDAHIFAFRDSRSVARWNDKIPITIQTCEGLQYWFADSGVVGIESANPEPDVIDAAIEFFSAQKESIPLNHTIGKPNEAVWITPKDSYEDVYNESPDRIRDRLGLINNKAPRYAIVFRLAESMSELARLDAGEHNSIKAPTVFDARGYERFRHWPDHVDAIDREAGRTYELDDTVRESTPDKFGDPELVYAPVPVSKCSAMDRCNTPYQRNPLNSVESHITYAEQVAGPSNLTDLVNKVLTYVN